MITRLYHIDELNQLHVQQDIKNTLLSGKLVVFPTETVYGIGANALDEDGIKRIYEVKGRPSDNPLIMHLSQKEDVFRYTKNHQPYVSGLMDAFWPGPLTMVFEKKDNVPLIITGGLNSVGIRIPSNLAALKVIDIAGVPICAPSANISGRPSSTLFSHVLSDFKDRVDIIIDGGKTEVGLESTVIDVTGPVPVILRPGVITKDMIMNVTKQVDIKQEVTHKETPKAPGMKYKHYAPKGKMLIVDGSQNDVINYINEKIDEHNKNNQSVGVIVTSDLVGLFKSAYIVSIGDSKNESEIASNLFVVLRQMDEADIQYIYSLSFHQGIYGEAIMNRLMKAANNQIIHL
jgi:L-threonylcarbamoyladenylate synthase